jgi:serine/threonine protein kinase
MHNLTGVFIEECDKTHLENMDLYCFNVIYPRKSRLYYVESKEDYINWVRKIKSAIGFSSLNDKYEVRHKLGKGKFGLVRLGVHKETQQKVAIKIMNKKEMNNQDLELVKTEIEILKVCQQPNIIRFYDLFENLDYIYIGKFIFDNSYLLF